MKNDPGLASIGVEFADKSDADSMDWTNDEKTKLPKDIMVPFGWKVLVAPMRQAAKTKGGIIIPFTRMETDEYLNYRGRIVAIGTLAWKAARYADMGMTEKDKPKVGDWMLFPLNSYQRLDFKGIKLVVMNDDAFLGRIPVEKGVSPWHFKLER
jgi:co-chaperonin GroES (HSP10)